MRQLDVGEAARQSGVPTSTLRYYEEKGLITFNGRHGLRRLPDTGVLERLALIGLGHTAGLSLDEIADMGAADGALRIDHVTLTAEASELDRTIRHFAAMRDGLRHAVACPTHEHMDCPTFRRLLRAAATGTIKPCQGASGAQQNGRRAGHPCPTCRP